MGHAEGRLLRYGTDGTTSGDDLRIRIQSYLPPPIVGAIDYAAALAALARLVRYEVTIAAARATFVVSTRFS